MITLIGMAIRAIFAFLCLVIYGLMVTVYILFYQISNTSIVANVIEKFGQNVYTILGVLMLFKLAFSVIQYIIDPDQFTNKENGFGAIMKNMFIVLALILVVPIIFEQAMKLQRIILKEDIIGRVVTGQKYADFTSQKSIVGEEMAFNILSGFIRPIDPPTTYINSTAVTTNPCATVVNSSSAGYDACINYVKSLDATAGAAYDNALKSGTYESLLNLNILNRRTGSGVPILEIGDEYVFEFNGLVASIVGGFVTYILLLFCIDIAVRSVKLSFLQIIAPIPIVSYMDPKSKKKVFDGWVKACTSTYADLFIRLAGIYFAVYLIQSIIAGGFVTFYIDANGNDVARDPDIFVMIFLIIGILMFAKDLPKLIEEIFGIKLSGDFSLNPLKKLGSSPYMSAAIGMAGGALGAAAGNIYAARKNGLTFGQGLRSATGGFFSGGVRGLANGYSGKNKENPFKNATDAVRAAAAARNLRADRNKNGDGGIAGVARRAGEGLSNLVGVDSGLTLYDNQIKAYEEMSAEIDAVLKRANSEMVKHEDLKFKDSAGNDVTMKDFKVAKEYLQALRNMDTSKMSQSQLAAHVEEINRISNEVNKTEKIAEQAYVDAMRSGSLVENGSVVTDAEITARIGKIEGIQKRSDDADIQAIDISTGKGLKEGKDKMNDKVVEIKSGDDYARAQINKTNDQKAKNGS